ncbi:MAG: phasin family protein [Alphaproteobacteria bacterium]
MARTKTGAERAMNDGAKTMREGFDKAAQGYEQFVAFGKQNAEAWLKSADVAGKGIGTIHDEFFALSRGLIEEGVAAAKTAVASKNVQEAFAIQTDFARSAFETYVEGMAKMGEVALNVAKDAAEPLQARATAFADLVQKRAA